MGDRGSGWGLGGTGRLLPGEIHHGVGSCVGVQASWGVGRPNSRLGVKGPGVTHPLKDGCGSNASPIRIPGEVGGRAGGFFCLWEIFNFFSFFPSFFFFVPGGPGFLGI